MIQQLDEIGVDALLLQGYTGVLTEVRAQNLWSRELHSSTQCDVRTPEKAYWLTTLGFKRIVLARELSLDEIKAIYQPIPQRNRGLCTWSALREAIRVYVMLQRSVSGALLIVENVHSSVV